MLLIETGIARTAVVGEREKGSAPSRRAEKGLGLGLQLIAAATVDDDGEGAMLGEDNLQAADEGVEGF